MNRKACFVAVIGTALVLTSCSKKIGQFSSDYFSTNPQPLEVVGEKVPATVTGRIPAKFFVKNATVTVTPYLVYNGQETASQPYTFQGEKVRGNSPVISYNNGGTVTIPVSVDYVPAMAQSTLELGFNVNQNGKQYVLPRVPVATGVITTAALADASTVNPAIGADAFQRIINEKYAADIMFLINQANIRAGQLNTDAMTELKKEMVNANKAANKEIKEINISSYASPDGSMEFNTKLAENREANTKSYLNNQLKKDKITEFGELTAQFTPEDWEGFQKLVEQSNIQDKRLILEVLKIQKDPELRERELRNLAAVFDELADQILPQLRYSRITASIDVIGKSDEEIARLASTNPSALNVEELLYAATLTDDPVTQTAIYTQVTSLYPADYRGWNDLGMVQYRRGNYDQAAKSFAKAAQVNSAAAEPRMNLGLIELQKANYDRANQYFGSAAGVAELGEALGTYYLKKGDNAAAARAFGDAKTNNAALAQILTKDYNKAKNTLGAIAAPDATTYYLMAILGARTGNQQMINNNLRKAISLDSRMASKAAQDLEFSNFNISSLLK